MNLERPDGIKGLTPREPVGAVITVGIKGDRGFPVERDRYHIVTPHQSADGRRAPHPLFLLFNEASPEHRKVIRGNLVHAKVSDCFEHHLKAQMLGRTSHPDGRPCCVGDGERAVRWVGPNADDFKEILCPGPQCEFSQRQGKRPASCKPWMRLLFRIRWAELVGGVQPKVKMPTPLVKFTSGSWRTTANAKGFFDQIELAAQQMGLTEYSLWGYPFLMTLTEQTKASEKSRFPVTVFTPEMDPVEFFLLQREKLRQIGAPVPVDRLLEQREPKVEKEDWEDIHVDVPTRAISFDDLPEK